MPKMNESIVFQVMSALISDKSVRCCIRGMLVHSFSVFVSVYLRVITMVNLIFIFRLTSGRRLNFR